MQVRFLIWKHVEIGGFGGTMADDLDSFELGIGANIP